MNCKPPETPSKSTFTVTLDGTSVEVSPRSHGTRQTSKTFHVVIPDDSAIFPQNPYDAIVFDPTPPEKVFRLTRVQDCYITIEDMPLPGEEVKYGFTVCVDTPDGQNRYCSTDPHIINDPEDL